MQLLGRYCLYIYTCEGLVALPANVRPLDPDLQENEKPYVALCPHLQLINARLFCPF
jgi:hypothetical protein